MSDTVMRGHSRRTFLKYVGASAAIASVGFSALGAAEDTCVFGLAVPAGTFFADAAEKAARIAIDEINADGGVNGANLDIIIEDSGGRADQAQLAFQALDSRGADFAGGLFFSEELIGLLPTFGVTRKLFFGTGPSTPDATVAIEGNYDDNKFFFRVGPANSLFILQASVTFAIGMLEQTVGWDSMVLMAEDAAWTQALTDSFGVLLGAFGSQLQIADVIRYPEETTDFSPFFNQAVDAMQGRNGGIFTIMAHTGSRPTSQWAAQQVPLPFYGINVQAQDGRFDQLTNGAAESVVTFTSAAKTPLTPLTLDFVNAFENSDFRPDIQIPSYNSFHTYDALRLFKAAAEQAGVLPDSEANTDAIIQALESFDGTNATFPGTTGEIAFYQRGETGVSPIRPDLSFPHDVRFGDQFGSGVWIQWQNGQQEVIFPPTATDGETGIITAPLSLPPWLS